MGHATERVQAILIAADRYFAGYQAVPSAKRLGYIFSDLGSILRDLLEENLSLREEITRLEIRLRSSRGR